jgi:hypothetical protein
MSAARTGSPRVRRSRVCPVTGSATQVLARRSRPPAGVADRRRRRWPGAAGRRHAAGGPAIRASPGRDQQRAIHQMQHRRAGVLPGDRLGGLQREPPREHRHRPEHPPLTLTQQPVAPLHRRRQRPVPPRRQPVPRCQQREPVTYPVQQLSHAQCLHPRRGQLDRQRHPVQSCHQPRHRRPGRLVQGEPRIHLTGPVREQRYRLRPVRPG